MKPVVVVLGMHRSGTSAVMRVLSALGCDVGPSEELVAPNDENPHGFYELKALRHVCDSLLARTRADWWRIGPLYKVDPTRPLKKAEMERLRTIVELSGTSTSAFALKEPRLCLLWPVLRPWFPRVAFVHMFRDPRSVARSLEHRNAMPHALGIGLWEIHNKRALNAEQGIPTTYVNYEELLGDPLGVCSTLAGWLEQQQLVSGAVENADQAAALVDKALNRSEAKALDCPAERALEFFDRMKAHASGGTQLHPSDLFVTAASWRELHALSDAPLEHVRAAREL